MPRRIHTIPTGSYGQVVGILQTLKVTTPAAGAEWTFTLPGGYYYRLLGGSALFTTSAAVANRTVGIQMTDGVNLLASGIVAVAFTASLAVQVTYAPSGAGGGILGTKPAVNIGPPNLWLQGNWVVQSITSNIDVADAYTKVLLLFECLDFGGLGIPELAHEPTVAEHMLIPAAYDSEV